ncbi:MAG: glycosyltransferase [Candidatus Bathyarchaeota archaeon]|nr:glycosyltransferase [Candidatus Bathyarchaeota archaeon]
MRKSATKPWQLAIKENYRPKVSIVVPTYNESNVIGLKLENLSKIEYPKELAQIIIIDSNSNDQTVEIAQSFAEIHPKMNIQILTENKRRGKSAALNVALKNCGGDVIIVSDADCFWPSDILKRALPYLYDSGVGAVSGPKILLNAAASWVTRTENSYLNSMNLMKLGQSKLCSTLFFEGGFSAYKKEALASFDPYSTGSDDCGTIITLAEKKLRALLLPEAQFYTTFPETWRGKFSMKIRRANQLVRVFWRYLSLLVGGRISFSRAVIIQSILNYLLGPLMFFALVIITVLLLLSSPYFALFFLVMLIPKVRVYFLEAVQNYLILLLSIFSVVVNKRFLVWSQPKDRSLLDRKLLQQYSLI